MFVGSVVEWLRAPQLMANPINTVEVQNPLMPFCFVLGKDTSQHFPLLGSLGKQL